MSKVNKTRYAILGMLSIEPMSGYDIRKTIKDSTQYFWNESNGQLYPTLAKLVEEKQIIAKIKGEGDRGKTIYKITSVGRTNLKAWLHKDVEQYTVRDELLLKVFLVKM